ncbi:MAG: LptF/LptG family permease [Campylobacteraceae bacterium]|jgi:lipopolysaccharide export system permease protein|nr:LptF/LptG family permease [Campylobacteraceae bacterium]
MGKTNHYLLSQFISVFGSLFFTLFFITSVIYFIQIARITSVIKITFFELGKLYLFLLPKVLIFTLPITFFIALAIVLFKLSRENETIVLFSLGFSPKKIAKFFVLISSLLSFFLVLNVLILMPLSKELQSNFVDYKKAEARFNIEATEFGQKFSDWFVFVNSAGKDYYKDIVMYQNEQKQDRIVSASEAFIDNGKGEISLELKNGKAYNIAKNEINQLDFETMLMRALIGDKVRDINSIRTYWFDIFEDKKKAKDFVFYMLIALFPLATTLFALSFGIVTYRYERSGIYFSISLVIIAYFAAVMILQQFHPIGSVILIFGTTAILSFVAFKQKVLKRF